MRSAKRGRLCTCIPFAPSIASAAAACAGAWPGMMSYDSLVAYRRMAHGIISSAPPPMMSELWWLTDQAVPGPGGMLILHSALMFGSLGLLLNVLRWRRLPSRSIAGRSSPLSWHSSASPWACASA